MADAIISSMDPNKQTLNEILALVRDNNRILHGMRRNAFFWGFVKFIAYAALFAAPIWLYLNFVSGTLDQAVNTLNKLQGTKTEAQTKFDGFEKMVKDLKGKLPSLIQQENNASSTR